MALLERRAVVITGAGRGLGRAFAIGAAREGARVVVNDIDADVAELVVADIRAEGGEAVMSAGSVVDWDCAKETIDCCHRAFGSVDGLVNNAVLYGFGHPWDEEPDRIRQQLEVNVLGALFSGTHAMRHMMAQRRGSIVNLTSNVMMGNLGMSTYGIAKGALASATFGWALELMPYNVRVNALAPGAATRGSELAGEFRNPNKSADAPEIVAPAAVYLLSDLSAGITGQIMFLMGRRLGLIAHPHLLEPVIDSDNWTAETIADAYDRVYRPLLQPVGRKATTYVWSPDE
jgi:NAD(P)-dependent dehydrogenase (short-subunit alcohol dehydrogenase family)